MSDAEISTNVLSFSKVKSFSDGLVLISKALIC